MLPCPRYGSAGGGEERLRFGHLGVFGDDLRGVPPGLSAGQWVSVTTRSNEFLGTATCNLSSRIALRLVSSGAAVPSKAFLERRGSARRSAGGRTRDGEAWKPCASCIPRETSSPAWSSTGTAPSFPSRSSRRGGGCSCGRWRLRFPD